MKYFLFVLYTEQRIIHILYPVGCRTTDTRWYERIYISNYLPNDVTELVYAPMSYDFSLYL